MKHLLGLQLWDLFKYAQLTEVVRLNDKLFVDLLKEGRFNLLKARFIQESDENYRNDTFHMYAENEPAKKRNDAVINDLLRELYAIEAHEKIPGISKYSFTTIQVAQNQNQTNTGDLAELLKLTIVEKVMLTVTLDT